MSLNASQILQRASAPDALLEKDDLKRKQQELDEEFKNEILNGQLDEWLKSPVTVLYMKALELKYGETVQLSQAHIDKSEIQLRAHLTKAKTIQEIISYARNRKW